MIPEVKQDIASVLRDAARHVLERDTIKLKELSNHTIHNASIFQDEDSISIAVVVYSLSKICERGSVKLPLLSGLIRHALRHLKNDEMDKYKKIIRKLAKAISDADSGFRLYIQDVFDKAQIRKGSRIYYHGISLAQTASLLGISQWDLMGYVGKTNMIDTYRDFGSVRGRLNFARKLFIR